MQNIFIDVLPPWVETGLQPAFYDLESGTVLQQTARMYAKVRELGVAFNTFTDNVTTEINNFESEVNEEIEQFEHDTTETVNEYIEKFNALHDYVEDYFENLDVQEEINNKLDEMVEAGTLQEIITTYIQSNVAWTFDTVSDMKSATNLVDGSFAQTLGFYNIDDNGSSLYKIRSLEVGETANEVTTIAITGTTLVAELVHSSDMNVAQFGIKGDGVTDESSKISIALAYNGNDELRLNFNSNKVYLAQNEIYLYSNTEILLNGGEIKSCHDSSDTAYISVGNGLRFMNNSASTLIAGYGAIKNITIKGGTLNGYQSGIGIFLLHAQNVEFSDVTFKDCEVGTHIIDLGGCSDVKVQHCNFDGFLITSSDNKFREMIQTDYASQGGLPYWGDTPAFDDLPCINIMIDGCTFSKGDGIYYPSAIGTHASGDSNMKNITIQNCKFNGTSHNSIRYHAVENLTIKNNYFASIEGYPAIKLHTYNVLLPIHDVRIESNNFELVGTSGVETSALDIRGLKSEDNVFYYINNITIAHNNIKGDWNTDTDYDVWAIYLGNAKNIYILDNEIDTCKTFIVKRNSTYFKDSNIANNKILNSANYIIATTTDESTYMEGSTGLTESDNIWSDSTSTFNINNFRLVLSFENNVSCSEASQSYYVLPVSERNVAIGEFIVADPDKNYRLPKCIRKFKMTAYVNVQCGSNTGNKFVRNIIDNGTSTVIPNGTRFNLESGKFGQYTVSSIQDTGHIEPTTRQYEIGTTCYLENGDSIIAKYGAPRCTYMVIEGL